MTVHAFDDGRVRHLAPDGSGSTWDPDIESEVRDGVLSLLGLSLLHVAWRDDDPELGPYLVALDATGAVVVVLVREHLSPTALVAGLARSAGVRQASWREVATWYPAGPQQLRHDWAAFRESLPPRGEAAPGLVIATGDIPRAVRAALEVVDGAAVTAYQVRPRVVGGNRVLAVEPVAARSEPRHLLVDGAAQYPDPELVGGVSAVPSAIAETGELPAAPAMSVVPPPAPSVTSASRVPETPTQQPSNSEPASEPGPRRRRRHRAHSDTPRDADALAAVVALVGESELVLEGSAGAVRAVLSMDQVIVVNGMAFDDPQAAALAAGAQSVSNGWAAWRFGESGPFLGEALEEALRGAPAQSRPPHRPAVER